MGKVLRQITHYLRHADWYLLILSMLSAGCGLVLIYSATKSTGSDRYMLVQTAAFVLGLSGFVAASVIDFEHISVLWKWLYVFNLLFIASLFFFGVDGGTGNKSWIRFEILGVGIQPAEVGKILMIFTLSQHIRLLRDRLSSVLSVVQLAAHVLVMAGAVYIFSKDLGMVLAFVFIGIVMVFTAGLSLRWFALAGFFMFAALPAIWRFLSQGQKDRILVIFDPSINEVVAWQAQQSKIALGAGQMTGQGYLNGRQTQFSQLPAKHTDFIFSVAGEEFGFIGCMLILLLLSLLVLRIFYVAWRADNLFSRLVCTGIGAMVLFQSVINIGMCVGLTPVIGLTLPFFSYGGSSLVTLFTAMGVVSGVRMRVKPSWLQ